MTEPIDSAARPPKRATLRTISEMTGLSLSTVSLSLRGGASLKEETRRKVADAAERLGYVPDRAGVRLRTGKTNVLALVLDGENDSIDFSRNLIQGIGQAIKGTRYHMTVMPEFERTHAVDSIQYILNNRAADGIIITHTSARDPRVQLMTEHNFPFVTHGRTEFYTPHAFHDFHSEAFARIAVERLVAKGCRNLLLVIGGQTTNNYHTIVKAFEGATARLGLGARVVGYRTSRSATSQEMREFGRDLAADPQLPNGIICDSELRSICMLMGLADGNLVPGRDFHFISKQTSDLLSTLYPALDTIAEDIVAAGSELARLLMRRIDGEPPESLQTLSEPLTRWRDDT